MTKSRKRLPVPTAIVAAVVLLVQAFLGGAFMGAQAAAGPRDAFGNVLCMTDRAGGTSQSMPHGGYDCDCCLSGCDVGTAIIPQADGIGAVPVAYLPVSPAKRPVSAPLRREELQPLGPRGPPESGDKHLGAGSVRA